jgi:hypothetical protein
LPNQEDGGTSVGAAPISPARVFLAVLNGRGVPLGEHALVVEISV